MPAGTFAVGIMMDPAPSVEDVAEALWQSVTGVGGTAQEVHEDWLVLPDDEKEPWRERAKTVIADWRKLAGRD